MKLAVFCTVAISVCGLSAMLIQGCKREQAPSENQFAETNPPPMLDTNPPVVMAPTNFAPIAPVVPVVPEAPATTEYVVVKGDTLGKIAKAHGVTLKALEDANPNVQPTRMKVGDKLVIPASAGGNTTAAPATTSTASTGGEEVYVVKSGDSLTKIARTHGTTIKAIEAANNLSTTSIKVGQKLKIPAKIEAPSTTVNAPPVVAPSPTPVIPAPSNPPTQQ